MDKVFSLNAIVADNLELGIFNYALIPEKKFTAANSALVRMLGYPSRWHFVKEELESLFANPKDKSIFFEMIQRRKNVKLFEAIFRKKNGEKLWVMISASCVYSKNKAKCIEGIVQDITYQKQLQNKLLSEKDFFQNLFDNIPDAVYFKDRKNRIIKVNKFYIKGTGLKESEILGKTDFDFFSYKHAKIMFSDDNYVLKTGKPIVGKIEKTRLSNGTTNQVITTKLAMHDKSGKIIGTMGITRDMTPYACLEKERLTMAVKALEVLGKALEMRDPYTFSHTRHVANIAEEIARALGWSENRILSMKLAGELHDLGKISIPLDILNKPGKLSDLEYSFIKEHAKNCYNLIKNITFPFPIADIIYQHHERLDGSGYPRKLKSHEILAEAKILAVSDVLEAMTHHRPYREALGLKAAFAELERNRGIKYDPLVLDVLAKLIKNNNAKEFWLEN
ncbi:MAG: PAS domain S-box protein [Candidatus Omnitrophica bacterium]|jgi:PAS domain S-box-containing protein/putative nucleotidyltransferase with HDIG domain|nr:PAS domain S-box protein [Candidatus Omnitrophota bacterium]